MKKPKKPSFSKRGIVHVFLLYAELIAFGQIAMWYFGDLSSLDSMWLYALPPILALLGYFLKAVKENTCGGIVYDCAMKQQEQARKDIATDSDKLNEGMDDTDETLDDETTPFDE